jgi:leucyl aminopeptidase
MHHSLLSSTGRSATVAIVAVDKARLDETLDRLEPAARQWARLKGFAAAPGETALLPTVDGGLAKVLFGLGETEQAADPFVYGTLPKTLPAGRYSFAEPPARADLAALAWVLGGYGFTRYRDEEAPKTHLKLPSGVDGEDATRIAESVFLARDLINTPANDLGPAELEQAARDLARQYQAHVAVTIGAKLAERGFPLIHAVGQASARSPRLIDLSWGDRKHPKVTLVGKGVCFDTGGLDLKTASGMALMKKDMGGAANALALARMVMDAKLPVRLRVLVPAVDNSVSGDAFRPGDIYRSRKGLTVEIGNTDAEGRLILADALALADEAAPDLLIDLATLTGAARVALGPDLPPFYTDDDKLADELARLATETNDPLWRMPLWPAYAGELDSKIANVNHISKNSFAGSIVAALFLKRFVERAASWVHLDIYAWTPSARPARPEGGEAQAIRALYALLKQRYGR